MSIRYPVLSVQRALIGAVTPNLRGVFVGDVMGSYILTFCYNQEPSSEEEELASVVDTEFIADFPDSQTEFKMIITPYPQKIFAEGHCVYRRYEPRLNDGIESLNATTFNSQNFNTTNMNITNLLLSAHRVLLEKVTPNLRGVFVGNINDKPILTFCYERELSSEEEKLASSAEIDFMSIFPPPEFKAEVKKIIIHSSQKVLAEGNCVYKRYEPSLK